MYNPTQDIAEINKVNVAQATKFAALFPNTTAEMMSWVNRALPEAGGEAPRQVRKGRQSESEWAPSALTSLSDRAARQNNEV